ncbi:MAG: tRNA uridine-5-carboxymethylaminomethyl(34) synthesis GTPase MnmE [Gammaproteobacteria bacterium]|nr:tRNA uridine-5-carboxymethylaminomethyl(34) synthesis GTPase MnmE [Gammaproteobacteria bacterium]
MATHLKNDTIVARATPAGRGGVSIVRVSGPLASAVASSLLGAVPPPRYATYSDFNYAADHPIDSGIALWFPGPNSFTGEDVLEIQGHGGPMVVDLLLERITGLGVRLAEPGEFSKRAFLNDKLDLTQAEAIVDLIDSGSRVAARAAQRSLQGAFSAAVLDLNRLITELRMHVEAAIDFPEEDIDFLSDSALVNRVDAVDAAFNELTRSAREGCLLRDGVTVVLAGKPNVGKSSLLNALAGYDAAIVTAIPGTTRDLVKEHIDLDGVPMHIIDTAGLRVTQDVVEQEGVKRTRDQLHQADFALLVVDANSHFELSEFEKDLPEDLEVIQVHNKCDLGDFATGLLENDCGARVSALSGAGLSELRELIKRRIGYAPHESGSITARRRHLVKLATARSSFELARERLAEASGELMADDLLQCQNALAEITGEFNSDDLLGEIFSNFCIGK